MYQNYPLALTLFLLSADDLFFHLSLSLTLPSSLFVVIFLVVVYTPKAIQYYTIVMLYYTNW